MQNINKKCRIVGLFMVLIIPYGNTAFNIGVFLARTVNDTVIIYVISAPNVIDNTGCGNFKI